MGLVKRGAADLKQQLQEASTAEQLMVLLWTSTGDERACNEAVRTLKRIAGSHPGLRQSSLIPIAICPKKCLFTHVIKR